MRTKCLLMVFGVCLFCLVTSVSRADVVYDESNGDPDLSDNYLAPTPIQLGYGSNTITLQINRDLDTGVLDLDLFRVDMPVGAFLTGVNLTYSLAEDGQSFLAFQSGDVWSFNMAEPPDGDPSECLIQCTGFGHFAPGNLGENLFVTMNAQMPLYGASTFDYPLPDSQYVFWAQELNFDLNEYSFDFTVSIPGDYNYDGTVNAADYTVWRNTLGNGTDPGDGADGNRNGVIDQQDYEIWKETYGMITFVPDGASVESGANVPEPTTLILSIVSSVLVAGMARRRR